MKTLSSRSPRRINFQHNALSKITLSTDQPPQDSLSWKLWLACQDIAEQALASDYIQSIKHGNLHPDNYGQYTVQDACYCYNAEADYQTLEERSNKAGYSELASFAQARYEGYQKYNKEFLTSWHIADGKAVIPSEAANVYINFEHHVANNMEPIYGVMAMIPCEQLWSWLANQLKADATPENLYSFWITENEGWHGAYRLDNFIDSWFKNNPDKYNEEQALYVMRSSMTCELNFFRSACGESPVAMPTKPEF